MGYTRLALYLVGLLIVVGAAWIFLTQTDIGQELPGGVALALILLLVGIGVMASAKSIDDRRYTRRVVHEGPGVGGGTYVAPTRERTTVVHRDDDVVAGETVVDERRYD